MPLYMKFGKVDGETTQAGFEKWITLSSAGFGSARSVDTPIGSTTGRNSSTAAVSEVSVSKRTDKSSTQLFLQSIFNTPGQQVKIALTRPNKDGKDETYLLLTMEEVLVSSYSQSLAQEASEDMTLNFTKIEFAYTPTKTDGTLDTAVQRATYDFTTAKAS